jgi:hypothetical protein
MAKGVGGEIITVGILGGLAYWLYSSGMLNSLINSFSNPSASGAAPGTQTQTPIQTVVQQPVYTPSPPACTGSGILGPLLARAKTGAGAAGASYGPNLPGTFTVDEWGYFLNDLCSGMADQYRLNADTLFPGRDDRGGPLNWSAFEGYARQAGLSGPRRILSTVARPGRTYALRPGSRIMLPLGTNIVRRPA